VDSKAEYSALSSTRSQKKKRKQTTPGKSSDKATTLRAVDEKYRPHPDRIRNLDF